jgi:endonuclease YncB( thermonuclease family)
VELVGSIQTICLSSRIRDGLAELDGNNVDAEVVNAQAFAKSRKLGIWDC